MNLKKTLRTIKIAGLSVGLLVLTGCSVMGANYRYPNAYGPLSSTSDSNSGLSTSALGTGPQIQAMHVPNTVLLRAPYNQSYYFNFNRSMISKQYDASINAQATYMMSHSSAKVLLVGNTDPRGSHEYNIALGERRALAVAKVLELDGVSQNQIRVVSYGDMKPIALGHTPTAYAKNRRVDLMYEAL